MTKEEIDRLGEIFLAIAHLLYTQQKTGHDMGQGIAEEMIEACDIMARVRQRLYPTQVSTTVSKVLS